jgi:SAM-dependent methyltransferase
VERSPESDLDNIVAAIQARVDERRRKGDYPLDLEQTLDAHFRRVAGYRSGPDLETLRKQVEALDALCAFDPKRIPVLSGIFGGTTLHTLVARATARQTQGILEQVQQFADGVREALRSMLRAVEEPHSHMHADLVGQLDAVFEQLAAFERGPVDSAAAVADLRSRVEVLEEAERARRLRPFFSSARFEDEFGEPPEVRAAGDRRIAERLQGCSPVLELGSGPGRLLDALKEAGLDARGVEPERNRAEECRRRGLAVEHDELLPGLRRVIDADLGGIVLVGVIERMTPQHVLEVVVTARDKLRAGGRLVIRAVNPGSLAAHVDRLFLDPFLVSPVHPAYLAFVVREAGFSAVEVEWDRNPSPGGGAGPPGMDSSRDGDLRRLSALLSAPQDYTLLATR